MQEYFDILKVFNENQIEYLIIGTYALKIYFPEKMNDYKINDCDILIENDIHEIQILIKLLIKFDWQVEVWNIAIDESVEAEFLKGKYYIRALKDDLCIDISYEYPLISWENIHGNKSELNEFPLASINDIFLLKKAKGTAKDLAIINLLQQNKNQ